MKITSSLKNLRKRHKNAKVVRRGKKLFLIICNDPNGGKFKAKQ